MKSINLFNISNYIAHKLNWHIVKTLPRPSTYYVKEIFGTKSIRAIEIGTYDGANALSMLKELNLRQLICIDPYLEYNDYSIKDYTENMNEVKTKAISKLNPYVDFKFEKSSEAIKEIIKNYDFIYIDGNHSYKYVKEDIENYYRVLNDGGIMGGHDIEEVEVWRAVSEFCLKNNIELTIRSPDWYFRK